jgi:hypothetical protein
MMDAVGVIVNVVAFPNWSRLFVGRIYGTLKSNPGFTIRDSEWPYLDHRRPFPARQDRLGRPALQPNSHMKSAESQSKALSPSLGVDYSLLIYYSTVSLANNNSPVVDRRCNCRRLSL